MSSNLIADSSRALPTKLLWLDMEMTGLDPATDIIIEVAAIVTDFDLQELAVYESGVLQDKSQLESLIAANEWRQTVMSPEHNADLVRKSQEGQPLEEVEQQLLDLIDQHWREGDGPVILAGNSIHADRAFIRAYWPALQQRLHYRMLDVSAWKVYMQGKLGVEFKKQETHRALTDIRESIAEFATYTKMIQPDA